MPVAMPMVSPEKIDIPQIIGVPRQNKISSEMNTVDIRSSPLSPPPVVPTIAEVLNENAMDDIAADCAVAPSVTSKLQINFCF